jgi:uncharacterized protein DUF1588/uncharacterized protein DUF1585
VTLGAEFTARRGLLGKGAILMATSHPDRSAPTLRGKWILENLFGSPPPPPPAVVPPLDQKPGAAPRTMRERMAAHRQPACAGCHNLIDPLGFAMDNFDAVGAWRSHDAGNPIDASGRLPDGTVVNGAGELRDAIAAHPDVFVKTFTERMMTYALGRGLQAYDMPVVRGIMRDAKASNNKFSSIVLGIVRSVPFQMRTGATPSGV